MRYRVAGRGGLSMKATTYQSMKAITYQRIRNDANGNPRYVAHMLLQYDGDVLLNICDEKLERIIGRYSKVYNGYLFSTYAKPETILQEYFNQYWED